MESKAKKGGKATKKPQPTGAAQGFRSFREIRDNLGRMLPVRLSRFVIQLAAKKAGIKAEDATKPDNYKQLLPIAQKIAKNPEDLQKLKNLLEVQQIETKEYLSEVVRSIKGFPGSVVIVTKSGKFKVSKPKAVESVLKFEKALRKDKTVAVVRFSVVYQSDKYIYILLK